jgi:hypothetical protein
MNVTADPNVRHHSLERIAKLVREAVDKFNVENRKPVSEGMRFHLQPFNTRCRCKQVHYSRDVCVCDTTLIAEFSQVSPGEEETSYLLRVSKERNRLVFEAWGVDRGDGEWIILELWKLPDDEWFNHLNASILVSELCSVYA